MLLITIQIVCLIYIVLTGPVFTKNIILLFFQVVAIFVILWTLWTIKVDNFSLNKKKSDTRRLIPKGPYKIVRNPIYSSILILVVSMVVNSFSVFRLIVLIVFIISLILTVMIFDRDLHRKFSDYSLYKQRTYRLIPFIF